jgi:hypothetical protein
MIATIVTTTTVSTVTVVTLGGSLAIVGIAALVTLLISKDVTTTSTNQLARRVNKALNIALIPLIVIFLVALGTHIYQTLY